MICQKHINILDFLFYKIGKQACDFSLQIQKKDGMFSKRKKYTDIGFEKNMWWLEKVNARSILTNEIVLDLDKGKNQTTQEFIAEIVKSFKKYNLNYYKYYIFNSNSGLHIHIFENKLFYMTEQERKAFRLHLIKLFNADPLKCSEKTMIALEYAKHWKSGKIKEFLYGNINEVK